MEPHQHPRETAVSGALFLQGNLCKSAGGNVVAACGRVTAGVLFFLSVVLGWKIVLVFDTKVMGLCK